MPGPPPEPTRLKILKGVHPYRINKNEPKPRSVSGSIPRGWATWMSDGAKRFWNKYAPVLSELGVLTVAALRRVLEGAGLDFMDLATAVGGALVLQVEEPEPSWPVGHEPWRRKVREVLRADPDLNENEWEFVRNMAIWKGQLSEKQMAWLERIFEGVLGVKA